MTARDRAGSTPVARDEVMEAAVEAAARVTAALDATYGGEDFDWDDLDDIARDAWRDIARQALTAALPHLTPQPDGDVRTERHEYADRVALAIFLHVNFADDQPEWESLPPQAQGAWRSLARRVLASGLVVPVGEVADLRESLDIQTSLLEDARAALESVKDRMDEHAYDELSCPLSDGACDLETGGMIRSRRDRAEAQVAAVRALHVPVDVMKYDDVNGVFVYENDEPVILTRLCRECSTDDAIEAVGDCEWREGWNSGDVQWPCATLAALDTAPASPTTDQVSIPRPRVLFGPKGMTPDEATAMYLRGIVDRHLPVAGSSSLGGSNVTATVRQLLSDVADALTPAGGEE